MRTFLKRLIREPTKWLAFRYYGWWLKRKPSPSNVILILAHKRSGSTLLQHLLFGHDDIAGFGQNHTSYQSDRDLDVLKKNTYWMLRQFQMPHSWIVDKLVDFKRHSIAQHYLASNNFRFIFLLREPEPTLLSMMQDNAALLANSKRHYVDTLDVMEQYAKTINDPTRAFFLTYTQLVEQTQDVLSALQDFLGLETPLSEDYPVLRTTGYGKYGDFTDRIKTGTILQTQRTWTTTLTHNDIADEQQKYEACCEVLKELCVSVESQKLKVESQGT